MTLPEKMEALKRAYAEMILNTAKEAAARVMASELRARRLEQDLGCTKEEAGRMLLYLKQLIDAKAKEAEITSLDQHKKIDVLESQLNEAEGIIIDLRAELNQAHEQLDEATNKKLQFSRQNENAEVCNITPNGTDVYSGENLSVLDHLKEPELELFRNGCAQRICATETSVVQERFLVGEETNPITDSADIEIANAVNESVLEENVLRGKNEEAVSVVRRSMRKRKPKFLDDVMTACGLHRSNRFKKPRQASSSDVKVSVDLPEFPKQEGKHTGAITENMELTDVSVKQG